MDPAIPSVLRRARALEHEALSVLYTRYLPIVYRFVLARVGDVHVAEDLTAETFVAMVESIERLRASDELSFAAWLLGIARNKVATHFRRQASRPTYTGMDEAYADRPAHGDEGDPLGVMVARENWAEVVEGLQHLTEEQRNVLLYRCVLGYETDEVGRLMGRQPGAIRALQFRALSSLSRFLSTLGTNPALASLRASIGRPASGRRAQRSDDAPRR